MPARRPPALSTYLFALVLVALLPMAVFAVIVADLLVDRETAARRAGLQERTQALLSAVDNQLKSSITALHAVSVSPALEQGDMRTLREQLQRLLRTQADWLTINLARPDRQQVLNVLIPAGKTLPVIPGIDGSVEEVVRTKRAVVGDLVFGPSTEQLDFAVRTAVVDRSGVKYVLSAVVKPDVLDKLLASQDIPPEWFAVVLDRNHRIVARSRDAAAYRGAVAPAGFRKAIEAAPQGWVSGPTLEGIAVQAYYRRSAETGWTVFMGIPTDHFESGARSAAWMLALGLLAAIVLGVGAAFLLARRISQPIGSLVQGAEAIRTLQPAQLPERMGIRELDVLGQALRVTEHAVHDRTRLIESEQTALREADRAKDRFLAMLAHELRNPLAALRAAVHILRAADPGKQAMAAAGGVIERQTLQMARLVDDLLDAGRIVAGKFHLSQETFNLAEVAEEAVNALRTAGRLERHRLSLERQDVTVHGDRARLAQVVTNLVDNAVKFTPEDGRIRLSVRPDGDSALVEVADEGVGFEPDEAELLFGLFVQGEPLYARTGHGLGIGLALVKHIVELHGGRVAASSAGPGRGACFSVRVPIAASR
jgi:signal transduction histidine kinase